MVFAAAFTTTSLAAQSADPSVEVADQAVVDGTVTVASAVLFEPGFIVIHSDNGSGGPGPVIGQRLLSAGENFNVVVPIDASAATSTLYAMLHADTNEIGVYEFGTVEGADLPVSDASGNVVTPGFQVEILHVEDQLIEGNTYTAASVTVSEPGWLVIHAGTAEQFGAVLGQAQLEAGTNSNVVVELAAEGRTPVIWPMLHVDTGEAGVYEFGTVEGADGPVVLNGMVAAALVWTVPHMRVSDQLATSEAGATITAESVLLDVPGFLVVHQDVDGSFGPVIGVSQPLPAGLSTNVEVSLDAEQITARVWPMLHVDTGEAGVYEFGTVEGADTPIAVDGNVVTFPINIVPSIVYEGQLVDNQLTINQALIDGAGWLVIHQDSGSGGPGPVIGQTQLTPGLNTNVVVTFDDPSGITPTIFPMLHADTGEAGVYEFGTVEGADLPVSANGAVVVGPFNPSTTAPATTDEAATAEVTEEAAMTEVTEEAATQEAAVPTGPGCAVSAATTSGANLRSAPSTSADRVASLAGGDSLNADGQGVGDDGFIWYRLIGGAWVRSDVVTATSECSSLPTVETPATAGTPATDEIAPIGVPEPEATDEA